MVVWTGKEGGSLFLDGYMQGYGSYVYMPGRMALDLLRFGRLLDHFSIPSVWSILLDFASCSDQLVDDYEATCMHRMLCSREKNKSSFASCS